jgi:hypothetical protein
MLRRSLMMVLSLAIALGAGAQGKSRFLVCLVLTTEGASAEGNALFQKYMALQPELLRSYAPLRFELGAKGFSAKAEGNFGYSAEELLPLERYGKTVLSSVKVELKAPPPPKAWKTAVVEFKVAALAAGGDAVQPGARAIELAARQLKLAKGLAWIESIELKSPGLIRATVGFAR